MININLKNSKEAVQENHWQFARPKQNLIVNRALRRLATFVLDKAVYLPARVPWVLHLLVARILSLVAYRLLTASVQPRLKQFASGITSISSRRRRKDSSTRCRWSWRWCPLISSLSSWMDSFWTQLRTSHAMCKLCTTLMMTPSCSCSSTTSRTSQSNRSGCSI